jgi:hypothetical protein
MEPRRSDVKTRWHRRAERSRFGPRPGMRCRDTHIAGKAWEAGSSRLHGWRESGHACGLACDCDGRAAGVRSIRTRLRIVGVPPAGFAVVSPPLRKTNVCVRGPRPPAACEARPRRRTAVNVTRAAPHGGQCLFCRAARGQLDPARAPHGDDCAAHSAVNLTPLAPRPRQRARLPLCTARTRSGGRQQLGITHLRPEARRRTGAFRSRPADAACRGPQLARSLNRRVRHASATEVVAPRGDTSGRVPLHRPE